MKRIVFAFALSLSITNTFAYEVKLSSSEIESLNAPIQDSCDIISQMTVHRSLRNIYSYDESKTTLVREYIELTRRTMKHGSWDKAAALFSEQETIYQIAQNNILKIQSSANREISQYINDELPSKDYLIFDLQKFKRMHDWECKARKEAFNTIVSLDSKLISLRAEPLKPWLDPKKRIPCPILQSPTCSPLREQYEYSLK